MSPPLGLVADVVRFSWVDGPGNRYVVFFQGCNLNCLACHNPHTIPLHSPRARTVEVAELVDAIRPLAPFLAGVTVSGGEATVQARFVRAFFERLGQDLPRLTRFVDSNSVAPAETWQSLLPVTDGFMLDLKAFDSDVHRRLTGSGNEQVLSSIQMLALTGKLYEVRLLLVPGVNDSPEMLTRTVDWLLGIDPAMRIKVIGFRQHGARAAAQHWRESGADDRAGYAALLSGLGVRDLEVV